MDIWAGFDDILNNIQSGQYATEYDFQADLFRIFNLAHDGHFRFSSDLLSKAILFGRPISVVSVSVDWIAVPKVYTTDDIRSYNAGSNQTMPSALTNINGENVTEFLQNWGNLGFCQDPDALYNTVFYELAFDAQADGRYNSNFTKSRRFNQIYPGSNTTIKFENVTISTFQN